ncbi:MAG TPA: hypothetical protein VF116_19335 [Ktedonobacterales bacterium]
MSTAGKFAFLDEGEALRRLGVDRDTLLGFVAQKRLRAYPGVGKGNFFRASDVEALASELRAGEEVPAAPGEPAPSGRKLFDPAYKVHVRLAADLKWYDLEEEDLQAWVREMTRDGYARQRGNITAVIARLQRLVELMDAAATGWQHLDASPAPAPAVGSDGSASAPATSSKPRRRELPMAPTMPPVPAPASTPTPTPPASAAPPHTTAAKPRRKPLPMFGAPPPADMEQ